MKSQLWRSGWCAKVAIGMALSVLSSQVLPSVAHAAGVVVVPDTTGGTYGHNVEAVKALNLGGTITLFYSARAATDTTFCAYESQLVGSTWLTQKVFSLAQVTWVSATVAGGTTYLAVDSVADPAQGPFAILSQQGNGSWNIEYEELSPTAHVGQYIRMGTVNGAPVALYTGSGSASSGYTANLTMLEKVAGTWRTTAVPIPSNGGIWGLDAAQVGSDVAILASTNHTGDFYLRRVGGYGGAWLWQNPNVTGDTASNLAIVGGQPAFLACPYGGGTPLYFSAQGSGFGSQAISPSSNVIVGSDLAVINGVPTAAFFSRNDNALHLRQLVNGAWDDRVLDTGNVEWREGVSLVEAPGGDVGVAYYSELPSGPISLNYIEVPGASVPEPSGLALAASGVVFLGARRSRRR